MRPEGMLHAEAGRSLLPNIILKPMELKLDLLHSSIEFASRDLPRLHVQKMVFHLPGESNKSWPSRFMHVYLRYSCELVNLDLLRQDSATSSSLTNLSVSPMHMQPVFELAEYWRFEPATSFNPISRPEWRVRLYLDGFAILIKT